MKHKAHSPYDLKQMQSLPLEAKIRMTKQRIKVWYESWIRYEIFNKNTGKTRYVTATEEPPLKEGEYINSKIDGQVYVSFSGGKDSTVLKHIVDSMYDDVPALFVNTGLEYPEIQKFAMSQKNVVTVRPDMRFDEVLKTYGYPVIGKRQANAIELGRKNLEQNKFSLRLRCLGITAEEAKTMGLELPSEEMLKRYEKTVKNSKFGIPQHRKLLDADFRVSAECCDVMKKKPAFKYEKENGRKPIIATMASESMLREVSWLKSGCNAFKGKRPSSQPMSFWTEQDVLEYIIKYNVPYCSVYGEIVGTYRNATEFSADELRILYLYEEENIISQTTLSTTGCDRTGCTFCAFGCHLEKSPNRFERLRVTHPRQYNYCINGGEYATKGFWQNDDGEWREFVFEDDDGKSLSQEEVEAFIEKRKDDPHYKFERKWQPNKEGLGLGKVLDFIGVKYD